MEQTITVTQLNEYVADMLSVDPFLRSLRVQGEISGFRRYPSGHLYFSLKDATSVVKCVMFRQNAIRLKFLPADGMQVILTGSASLYLRDGAYQLYVDSLEKQGAGQLYQRYVELKDRLEAEGYFDSAHKKPIPAYPGCVGVVTSGVGAAVQDILQIIDRRFPDMPIVLAPVRVQGASAAGEIADAIRRMNEKRAADVLIVGRGGGSIEDLWAFNEPIVAKAIYDSDIPIISAVGHETDFTIADFVADLRAPTPSAAAELAVPIEAECRETVSDADRRLRRALKTALADRRSRVELMLSSCGFHALTERVRTERMNLDYAGERMQSALNRRMTAYRSQLGERRSRIEPLDPRSVMRRGFALVSDGDGRVVTGIDTIRTGMAVRLTFSDGTAGARIETVERKD